MKQPLWKSVWNFLKGLNIDLPYDPATPPLGIYSEELKAYVHTTTFTQMFIAVLSIIAESVNNPKASNWRRWYSRKMERYLALKRT